MVGEVADATATIKGRTRTWASARSGRDVFRTRERCVITVWWHRPPSGVSRSSDEDCILQKKTANSVPSEDRLRSTNKYPGGTILTRREKTAPVSFRCTGQGCASATVSGSISASHASRPAQELIFVTFCLQTLSNSSGNSGHVTLTVSFNCALSVARRRRSAQPQLASPRCRYRVDFLPTTTLRHTGL